GHERTRLARVEPLPRLDSVPARAAGLRACPRRCLLAGAWPARRPLARVLSERAVPDHRPEAPRARRPGAGALRRAAALGRGLARVAPRADLACPGPCSRAAAGWRPRRVGPGRRGPGAELVRHLPRPRPALELVGPRGAP